MVWILTRPSSVTRKLISFDNLVRIVCFEASAPARWGIIGMPSLLWFMIKILGFRDWFSNETHFSAERAMDLTIFPYLLVQNGPRIIILASCVRNFLPRLDSWWKTAQLWSLVTSVWSMLFYGLDCPSPMDFATIINPAFCKTWGFHFENMLPEMQTMSENISHVSLNQHAGKSQFPHAYECFLIVFCWFFPVVFLA